MIAVHNVSLGKQANRSCLCQGWKLSLDHASNNCMEQVLKLCCEESEMQLFAATPQNVLGFWPPMHVKALGICEEEVPLGLLEP